MSREQYSETRSEQDSDDKLSERTLNRRHFLQVASAGAAALTLGMGCSLFSADKSKAKPNILVMISDDQGWGDIGVYGCKDIPTPYMDSIARNGVRFTDAYVTAPVCAPSRAGLMSGRYQQRFGVEGIPLTRALGFGPYPEDEPTLADRIRAAGYVTGMVGKWHFGEGGHPIDRGFDEYFGYPGPAHYYLPGKTKEKPPFGGDILRGKEVVEEKEYLTDAYGREGAAFIDRHRNEPFFLYLAFNAPHVPLEATEKYLKRFDHIKDPYRRLYAAVVSAMDDAVGQVLESLRKNGLEENTLVFFISDNGGGKDNNASLREGKGSLYDGGIRVPMMMQWKGNLPAGQVYEQPVMSFDIHATALSVAGAPQPADRKIEGVDLLPYITGKNSGAPHEALYWRHLEESAIRRGDWKCVFHMEKPDAPELYNLRSDIGEEKDLAKEMPEKAEELARIYKAWDDQIQTPKWLKLKETLKKGRKRRQAPAE